MNFKIFLSKEMKVVLASIAVGAISFTLVRIDSISINIFSDESFDAPSSQQSRGDNVDPSGNNNGLSGIITKDAKITLLNANVFNGRVELDENWLSFGSKVFELDAGKHYDLTYVRSLCFRQENKNRFVFINGGREEYSKVKVIDNNFKVEVKKSNDHNITIGLTEINCIDFE